MSQFNTQLLDPTPQNIETSARALLNGALVAFPTETVFGLGAVVSNEQAVSDIFRAKGRPADHPLIAHVPPLFDLTGWVQEVTPTMQILMDAFWPGPLTLVVPKGPRMPLCVTGGQQSVGLRCPSHPVAIALLTAVGVPVAAPSANRFGKISPTRAAHVMAELQGRIPYVLDGAVPQVGIESTIVSLLGDTPAILRPGVITSDQLQAVLGIPVLAHAELGCLNNQPRVSGALEKHYSPDAKVRVLPTADLQHLVCDQPTLIVGWSPSFLNEVSEVQIRSRVQPTLMALNNVPEQIAQQLYLILRMVDEQGYTQVVFEQPESAEVWAGIADRLKRASA